MVVDEDGEIGKVTVNPEVCIITHERDGVRIETRRGQPYDAAGTPIEVAGYEAGGIAPFAAVRSW